MCTCTVLVGCGLVWKVAAAATAATAAAVDCRFFRLLLPLSLPAHVASQGVCPSCNVRAAPRGLLHTCINAKAKRLDSAAAAAAAAAVAAGTLASPMQSIGPALMAGKSCLTRGIWVEPLISTFLPRLCDVVVAVVAQLRLRLDQNWTGIHSALHFSPAGGWPAACRSLQPQHTGLDVISVWFLPYVLN